MEKSERVIGLVALSAEYANNLSGFQKTFERIQQRVDDRGDKTGPKQHLYVAVSRFENEGNFVHLRVLDESTREQGDEEDRFTDIWVPAGAVTCYFTLQNEAEAKRLGFRVTPEDRVSEPLG